MKINTASNNIFCLLWQLQLPSLQTFTCVKSFFTKEINQQLWSFLWFSVVLSLTIKIHYTGSTGTRGNQGGKQQARAGNPSHQPDLPKSTTLRGAGFVFSQLNCSKYFEAVPWEIKRVIWEMYTNIAYLIYICVCYWSTGGNETKSGPSLLKILDLD